MGRLPRTGWVQVGIPDPESIAAHTSGVAFIALALAEREEPPLDPARTVALALLHDAPEALLTDLPRAASELLGRDVKHAAEGRAAELLLGPLGSAAQRLFAEVHARDSRAARFVAVCDKLHLGLQVVHQRRLGRRGLDEFERGLAALDCGEFRACSSFKATLLAALPRGDEEGQNA